MDEWKPCDSNSRSMLNLPTSAIASQVSLRLAGRHRQGNSAGVGAGCGSGVGAHLQLLSRRQDDRNFQRRGPPPAREQSGEPCVAGWVRCNIFLPLGMCGAPSRVIWDRDMAHGVRLAMHNVHNNSLPVCDKERSSCASSSSAFESTATLWKCITAAVAADIQVEHQQHTKRDRLMIARSKDTDSVKQITHMVSTAE